MNDAEELIKILGQPMNEKKFTTWQQIIKGFHLHTIMIAT